MAAYNPSYPNKSVNRETALKLFTGETIAAFDEKNVGLGTVSVRSISGGNTAQWVVTGKAALTDIVAHTPGEEVVPKVIGTDEVTIAVTTRYVYSTFLDNLDAKLAQFQFRGELAHQAGHVLAVNIDKDLFYLLTHGVGTYTPLLSQSAAAVVTATGYAAATTAEAKGNAILEAMFAGRSALDGRDVIAEPIFVTSPEDYYNLVQSTRGVNTDYASGNGSLASGRIREIGGTMATWTNHLDKTDQSLNSGIDATGLLGLMYTKDVVGVVKAMDVTAEANYIPERLGYLLVAYYALGMGVLNPTGMVQVFSD